MSRYIDADALLSKGPFVVRMNDWGEYFVTVDEINNMPTVDAVPVVRCGECNRHEEPRDTGLKAFVWCNFYNTHKLKNGYCNCGERKDGEG